MKKKQPKNSLVKTKQSSDVANTLYERIVSVIRDARASIIRAEALRFVKSEHKKKIGLIIPGHLQSSRVLISLKTNLVKLMN